MKTLGTVAVVLLAGLPFSARATNGYFSNGFSDQQLAMGGAGTAMVEDAGVAIINPAGAVWTDSQLDINLSLFVPNRYYDAGARGPGATTGIFSIDATPNGAIASSNRHFYIPGMVYNHLINDRSSIGVAMYGNGGQNTSFDGGSATFGQNLPLGLTGIAALGGVLPLFQAHCNGAFGGGAPLPGSTDTLGFCGNRRASTGVDLIQLFIAPFYSRKITHSFSIGIEPLIAVQRFKAKGLAAFAKFSNDPAHVTDNGYNYSIGGGVRVGFLWEVYHGIGIGGSYQSRVYMTRFKKYAGLFAGRGSFDIPSNFNLGIQLHPFPRHRFIFDFQRINYHEVRSVGNRFNPNTFVNDCAVPRLLYQLTGGIEGSNAANSACLGAANGPGFGWRDMVIYKFGYQFRYHKLKLRVGYSFGRQPIPTSQILFNVLAPGVIERHLTGGLSYQYSPSVTFDLAYAYAFGHSVTGKNPLSNAPGSVTVGQNGNLVGLKFDAGQDPNDQSIRINLREFEATFGVSYHFD